MFSTVQYKKEILSCQCGGKDQESRGNRRERDVTLLVLKELKYFIAEKFVKQMISYIFSTQGICVSLLWVKDKTDTAKIGIKRQTVPLT